MKPMYTTSLSTLFSVTWHLVVVLGLDETYSTAPYNADVPQVVTLNPASSWLNGTSGNGLTSGQQDARGTSDPTATLSYSFIGSGTTIMGDSASNPAMQVTIDGSAQTVNAGANGTTGGQGSKLFSISDLPVTLHNVTVSPSSGGLLVTQISWTFPGEMPPLVPGSNETMVTLQANSSGINYSFNDWVHGDVGKSQQGVPYAMSTNQPSASFTYLYNGTGTIFYGDTDHQQFISVFVDGIEQPVDILANDTSGLFIRPLFTAVDLPFAAHNITVVNSGVLYISTVAWLASSDGAIPPPSTSTPGKSPGSSTPGEGASPNSPDNPLSSKPKIAVIIGGAIAGLILILLMFTAGYISAIRSNSSRLLQRSRKPDATQGDDTVQLVPEGSAEGKKASRKRNWIGGNRIRNKVVSWGKGVAIRNSVLPEKPEAAVPATHNWQSDPELLQTHLLLSYPSFSQTGHHPNPVSRGPTLPVAVMGSHIRRSSLDSVNHMASLNPPPGVSIRNHREVVPRSLPPPPRQVKAPARNARPIALSRMASSDARPELEVETSPPNSSSSYKAPDGPESPSVGPVPRKISPASLDFPFPVRFNQAHVPLSPESMVTATTVTESTSDEGLSSPPSINVR